MKPSKTRYYQKRSNMAASRFKRAAQFIYLNKCCWNGLYRVNLAGEFNVPYGAPRTNGIYSSKNLTQCSKILSQRGISITCRDFEKTCATAKKGDFVFFDPPYVTKHDNNGFVEWNESIFSWDDQIRLAKLATELADAGVYVLVTNANHQPVKKLYSGFNKRELVRQSTLASNPDFRGEVKEAIIYQTI